MKKYIYYILVVVWSLLMLMACSDFLDKEPDDMLTQEMVFNDKRRVEEWLARCYNQIPAFLGDSNEARLICNMTDDYFISVELGQWMHSFIISARQGNWNPLTDMGFDIWGETYKAVRSAYTLIENVKPLPAQGLMEDDVEMMKHEARFLIAYYYTRMLSYYGPFPLVTRLIPSDTPISELMISRTPYDEIVNYLDKELLELSQYFPNKLAEENSQFGRPTKGICLAVRARMLLYAASPLFNGNPDYADLVNKDGSALFPQAYDVQKWKRAADACRDFLDVAEMGVYELYKEKHADGEIDPFLSFQNLFLTTAQTNKEIIFARPSGNIQGYVGGVFPRGFGGNGFVSTTQNLVDQFAMRNGLPITDPNSGYVEDGFTSEPIYYEHTDYDLGNNERNPGLVVDKGIYNMYANREPRFYVSIRYDNSYIPAADRKVEYKNGGKDGRPSHDSPQCGVAPLKGVSPEDNIWAGQLPYRPSIIMRLAEIYLNYAEALNEYDPSNPEILKYVNLVRERAGIPGLSQSILGKQEEMREAIRRERRVEFAFEGDIRYNDMRRWKIAELVMDAEPTMGMNPWGSSNEEFYQRTEIQKNVFTSKMYLWPIHQSYMDNNPNLVQNKFW